ncbi:adenosine deaminase [Winogradskya humida]|nr:adenosine deaminase [Actinoplanes humidus]
MLSDEDLIALPKADLHVHLVGSAAPHTVVGLAARHPGAGVPTDLRQLADFYAFRDFAHFLRVYTAVSALVRTPQDIEALVLGLGADLSEQGVVYAEVTVTPVTHTVAGIHPAELAEALGAGARAVRAGTGVELAWVYDISSSDGPAGAQSTLDAALRHPPPGLVGFGLGGPEQGVRRSDYRDVFAAARAAGLHSVPHAGETTGPGEVWAAVRDLGAERIGHGIAAAHDPLLLEHLIEHNIALEICPSSNVATGAVPSLAEHPLPGLLSSGVPVVLASDDPPMFGTSLLQEYQRARDTLHLSSRDLIDLAAAGIRSGFSTGNLPAVGKNDCSAPAADRESAFDAGGRVGGADRLGL